MKQKWTVGESWHAPINVRPSMPHAEYDRMFDGIRSTLSPTPSRLHFAYADFQFAKAWARTFCGTNRIMAEAQLRVNPAVHFASTYTATWRDNAHAKTKYAFDISPPGNGLDCYRTWESPLLGMIVITWKSQLTTTGLYDDLPVVSVSNWSEITTENLEVWLEKYGDVLTDKTVLERSRTHYWEQKMRSHFNPRIHMEHWSEKWNLSEKCS